MYYATEVTAVGCMEDGGLKTDNGRCKVHDGSVTNVQLGGDNKEFECFT